ncbi:lysozyme inhibitor LprI family protein [uncultured Clostridium sp.]|uniref:lysozyme inhibitor LprI family protein n=1 Tax=uncultured Clostridium sp. TaxID=59620 RepID=UPI0026108E74|nr:lysozyme inhibitor LprI family protein [uncultured Clostridium sp.]
MKKKVLSIIIAAIVVIAVVAGGCYMYMSKNAIKNDMAQANELTTQGNYTAALNEYGVVLNKDSNNTEAKNMENIINGYLTAKNEYDLGEYNAAMTAINGIKDYTGHSNLTDNINSLKTEITKQMNIGTNKAKEDTTNTTENASNIPANATTRNTTATANSGAPKKAVTDNTSVNANTVNKTQTTTATNKEEAQNSANTVAEPNTQNTQTGNNSTSNATNKSKSSTTSTNSLAGTKQEYLDQLNATKEKLNNYISGQSQTAMNAQSYEIYNIWNNKLNEIWGTLEQKLPANKMSELRTSENQWIKDKEAKEAAIKAQYQGGSVMPLEVNMELASLTEQRCYYLVNNYM